MSRLALLLLLLLAACDGGSPLVGTWETAGGDVRTTFFADGSARIVARPADGPEEAYDARYTVAGDTLLTLSGVQATERFRLSVAPDRLVLESPATGMRQVLTRVRG